MPIFNMFSPTSNHLHPLQVENCDSNSRLVVDEDDNGKFRLERGEGDGCQEEIRHLRNVDSSIFPLEAPQALGQSKPNGKPSDMCHTK